MLPIQLTNENFEEEVLSCETPVLIDFWAPWCGPCRMVSPIIDEIAEETSNVLKVGKVNVDEEPELAAHFGIINIPTILLMENGEVVSKIVGAKSKKAILKMIG